MDKPKKTPVGYMFDCLLDKITRDDKGHVFITLKSHSKINDDILNLVNTPLECSIKSFKAKKSNNANAYCWELCAAIAAAIGVGSQDVYREALRQRGVYKDYPISADDTNDANDIWTQFGIGWFTEKVDFGPDSTIILRCYYGTSTYNTSQMARIINYLTEEADNLKITTLSTRKKNELIKNWTATDILTDNSEQTVNRLEINNV